MWFKSKRIEFRIKDPELKNRIRNSSPLILIDLFLEMGSKAFSEKIQELINKEMINSDFMEQFLKLAKMTEERLLFRAVDIRANEDIIETGTSDKTSQEIYASENPEIAWKRMHHQPSGILLIYKRNAFQKKETYLFELNPNTSFKKALVAYIIIYY